MSAPLPLVGWASSREIEKLVAEREMLRHWILRLPRGSHKRLELEGRQKALTTRQLALEAALRDRKR